MRRSLLLVLLVAACSSGSVPAESPPSTASSAPTAPATSAAPVTSAEWTTYGGNAQRSSTVAGPDPSGASVAWRAALDGRVYGSPLVVGGRVTAATEGGSVYALAPRPGQVTWRRHLAEPVPASALP